MNALTRRLGPLPAWAWIVVAAGVYLWYSSRVPVQRVSGEQSDWFRLPHTVQVLFRGQTATPPGKPLRPCPPALRFGIDIPGVTCRQVKGLR